MKTILPLLFAATGALFAQSAPIGRAGTLELRTDEIREALAGLESGQDAALAQDPAALGQYVRALLIQRLVLQEALAAKWDQDPATIAKLVRARESTLAESWLDSASKVDPAFPSATELTAAYEAAKPQLQTPRTFRLAQIFIAQPKEADKAATDKAKARLEAVAKRLKEKNADFAAIAASESDETGSKAKGGEIGWLSEAQVQPEIRERLPKLAAGGVSEPVKLEDGWHLLKVLEIREARTPALEEVREALITRLRSEKARLNRQEYLAKLVKDHPVAINELELGKIAEPRKP